jgi:transposase
MDSDRRSAQVERLKVVDTGRRRRWSEDEKLKIVLESLQAPRQVAATARRYGVSRSLLLRWRRSFRPEKDAADQTGFVPAMVVTESGATPGPVGPAGGGAIEIEFAAGARMRITGMVDAATLKAGGATRTAATSTCFVARAASSSKSFGTMVWACHFMPSG